MDELQYIWSLGFSPADTMRAITVALLLSLLVVKSDQIARYALYALLVDRVFPILMMAVTGDNLATVWSTLSASFRMIGQDVGILAIRYVVMFAVISFGFAFRSTVHKRLA